MIDKRIIEYIRQELSNGTSLKKIEELLLKAGHEQKIVQEHIKKFKGKPKLNKIYLLEGIAVIAVLLLFYFLFTGFSEKEYSVQYLTHEEDLEGGTELFEEALKLGNSTKCADIGNKDLRDQCFGKFESKPCDQKCEDKNSFKNAMITKNPSFCAEISDKALNEQCHEVVEVKG